MKAKAVNNLFDIWIFGKCQGIVTLVPHLCNFLESSFGEG